MSVRQNPSGWRTGGQVRAIRRTTISWVARLCVMLACAVLTGCRAAPRPSLVGTVFDPDQPAKYVLHPGDQLSIRYPSDKTLDQEVTIRADGKISLAYVGDVVAALKSPSELRDELNALYGDVLKRPSVTVIVEEESGRYAYFGGEIGKPGSLLLHPNETLAQAVFHAGGLTRQGHSDAILLLRACPGNGVHVLEVDLNRILSGLDRDVRLQPLDIVYVPQTTIAKVGDFVDQYINRVIPRPFSALFTYELHTQPIDISGNQAAFPIEITRGR